MSKVIKVDYIPRVEGEGFLHIKVENGKPEIIRFGIFEPPRFFEAFLIGRSYEELPEITARICGICYQSYFIVAAQAVERAFGVEVPPEIKKLRKLAKYGEWIQSHILHIALLHLPDFLGYPDAIHMAKDHGDLVKTALRIKKAGNSILETMGGRAVNPVNFRVGGLYRALKKEELTPLLDELKWAADQMPGFIKFLASLDYPDFERDYEFLSLSHPDEYPVNEGNLITNKGINVDPMDYESVIEEFQVPYSNAYRVRIVGRDDVLTGPLARVNLNFEKLHPAVKDVAKEIGFTVPCRNQYKSIIARGLETYHAILGAIEIIENYQPPEKPYVEVKPKAGKGASATEAARGILYHRYTFDENGKVTSARIIAPTTHNQYTIENDFRARADELIKLPEKEAALEFEKIVRNYDPCISCATHFLKLKIER